MRALVYLVKPRRWSDFWYGWMWFLRGQYEEPIPLLKRLMEAPLPAHALGSFLIAGVIWFARWIYLQWGFGALMWFLIFVAHAVWQALAIHRRAYGDPPYEAIGQAFWRMLIGAASAVPLAWWLR